MGVEGLGFARSGEVKMATLISGRGLWRTVTQLACAIILLAGKTVRKTLVLIIAKSPQESVG